MSKILIRPIELADEIQVASLIREVMPEFGASGPGFAMIDPEVSHMAQAYAKPRHAYFVVEREGKILGGGGIAPLIGGDKCTCELRKMYFKKELRGLGFGQKMMDQCLVKAREFGYKQCYLETLKLMADARKLYLKNGFGILEGPMGTTGHFGCDHWYLKNL